MSTLREIFSYNAVCLLAVFVRSGNSIPMKLKLGTKHHRFLLRARPQLSNFFSTLSISLFVSPLSSFTVLSESEQRLI